ncbi:hypothetical protein ACP70R_047915 [Stipagrostis hirtigluma subsp. patula]
MANFLDFMILDTWKLLGNVSLELNKHQPVFITLPNVYRTLIFRKRTAGHAQVQQGRFVVCNPEGPLLCHKKFLEGLYISWERRSPVM